MTLPILEGYVDDELSKWASIISVNRRGWLILLTQEKER